MRLNFHIILRTTVCMAPMLIVSQAVVAAEWFMEPSIRAGYEYNDNARLTLQPHDSVNGYMVGPKLGVGASSGNWRINGSAAYTRRTYNGAGDLDRNDQYYTLGGVLGGERSIWRLDGSLSRSSILTDRLFSPNTGLVQVNTIQDIRNISPSWTWSIDERKQLQLTYNYNDVSFVNGSSVGLSDYSSRGVTAQLMNQLDPLNQVFISVGYSTSRTPHIFLATASDTISIISAALEPKATESESHSTVYQGGITHAFSETSNGTLAVGLWNTSSKRTIQTCEQPNPFYIPSLGGDPSFYPLFGDPCLKSSDSTLNSKQQSSVFNASLQKQFESTKLDLGLNRSFYPSGTGDQVRTDSVNFTISRSISARLTASLAANTYKVRGTQSSFVVVDDRSLYQIEPKLHWAWTEELDIDASYRYMRLKRITESKAATSNSAYVTLTYAWPKMSFSR